MEVKVTGKLEIEQKGKAGKQENTAMQDELLKQLHEQYAVNNNANLGTIVTLVVAVIAVIGYFGYVYVHTGVEFSKDFGCLIAEEVNGVNVYYLDALLLIYLASVLILGILTCLCAYQGVAQRKEQFIIHAIRRKYFGYDYLNQRKRDRIFPKGYHPYHKKGLDIVQGLYGELIKIFVSLFFVLTSMVVIKFSYSDDLCVFCEKASICERCAAFIVVTIIIFFCWLYCQKQIESYYKREIEDKQRQICKSLKQQSEACKTKNKPN